MSTDAPVGSGFPPIVDGYNQNWDLGAGTSENRTALPSNNGTWPNVVKFNVIGTNVVTEGNPIVTKLYYQYGGQSNLTAQIYFDQDFNPYNSNGIPVLSLQPPVTGSDSVFFIRVSASQPRTSRRGCIRFTPRSATASTPGIFTLPNW